MMLGDLMLPFQPPQSWPHALKVLASEGQMAGNAVYVMALLCSLL